MVGRKLTANMPLKVFISSTGKDLHEYRQAAIEVCNRLKIVPVAMEFFEAMGLGATNGSKSKLEDVDLYIGIFAHRYGYIEKGFDKSVTEIEFDYAADLGLERLCFVINQTHPWPLDYVEIENYSRIQSLKERVRLELIAPLFTTVDDFKLKLTYALGEAIKRYEIRTHYNQDPEQIQHIRIDGNLALIEQEKRMILSGFPNVRRITIKERIVEGNSGSQVFEVTAQFRDSEMSHPCFLKIHHSQGETPRIRHEEAFNTNLKPYMPKLLDSTPWDEATKQIALLYDNSKGESYFTLDRLIAERFAEAYELIYRTCVALADWNTPILDRPIEVHDVLIESLSHSSDPRIGKRRLDPDSRDSIYARLKHEFGLESNDLYIRFEGAGFNNRPVLPNPLSYLSDKSLWHTRSSQNSLINAPFGHVHGDLNVRNILMSTNGDERDVIFIDFDTYDKHNLIFVDFAQLELSILLKLCSPVYGEDNIDTVTLNREEIVYLSEHFASTIQFHDHNIPNATVRSAGIQLILQPIRQMVWNICELNRDYITAFWMARFSTGLEFSRKRKAKKSERIFALLYSADSLKMLLRLRGQRGTYGAKPKVIGWPLDKFEESIDNST